ncbi:hypothetical protein EVG20_g7765 [Dentipellis fragilis]|uniref:Uncharacterized protein n=1 Tax=Dentipellis fragilis TaxID=205917 RepID=A0A4Y9YCB9_9AGAM|nr:hypothetical protein EVG20_g7765 [Dentipellis fragilis]
MFKSPGQGSMELSDAVLIKQRRNSLSLVCSSPPEILQYIFDFYVNSEDWTLICGYRGLPATVLLSHVCSCWREVCLDDCRLWSCISLVLPRQWALEYFKRSGESPLRLSFLLEKHRGSDMAQMAVHAMHRIRCLNVHGSAEHLQTFLNSLIDTPAPILATFFLFHSQVNDAVPGNPSLVRVPTDIFARTAPRLQHVMLDDIWLRKIPVQAFLHLRYLSSPFSALEGVWRLLQAPRQLKILHCYVSSASDQRHPRPPLNTAHLHKRIYAFSLTNLVIYNAEFTKLFKLLEALVAPSLAQIAVIGLAATPSDIAHCAPVVARALSPHARILRQIHGPIHELTLEESSVTCWPIPRNGDHFADFAPFGVEWGRGSFPEDAQTEPLFDGILDALPLEDVHTLVLRDFCGISNCLHALSNVTELNYSTPWALDTLYLLQAMLPKHRRFDLVGEIPPSQEEVLFPQLTRLTFTCMYIATHGGIFLHVLRRLAQIRQPDGEEGLEIDFRDCPYSAAIMVELKKYSVVTWNGGWCPPFSFGGLGEDPALENWDYWGSVFDELW